MTALLLLLVAGVATLGWQSRREGGAALLAAAAVSIVAWETLLSSAPTSWPVCIGLVGLFLFIEQRHVQAGNRRLASALDERERLIADLDTNRAALTQLQAARTRLLASISHDLCQPLQAIRLYAEAMRSRVADAGLDELLRHQLRAADDAVDMVEQFGDFSAIEQGSLRSRSEPVDLREVIHRVADGLRATRAQPAVRVGEHGRMQWVSSDRSQITRIVQNLAANALRHARAAHADTGARVVLACREHHGDLAIEVIDNGQGIPADKLEAIFEPYVQLGGTGASRGGRGLALAIARGLAQQLGLRFAQVRSLPGRGAWFRVIVPAAMRIAAPGPAEKQPEARSQRSGRMIAVLDDEDAPRLALAAALRAAGAYCIEAAEFTALRRLLDAELRFPDALLFDLDLHAEIDGVGAVRLLREAWELDVPAVIVTGRVDARGAISLPDRCVLLAKPVGLGDIDAALRRTAPQDDRGLIA